MTERTLLLVDDEENIVAALARLLRGSGYKILKAGSGEQGLALLAQNDVGVIVSDQRMPEMTGVEFFSRVKELYPKTVRMILSGYADLESVKDAINRGAIYKFITKPWDEATLCANIAEAFDHHELMQQKELLLLEIEAANHLLAQVNQEWADAVVQRDAQIERITRFSQLTQLPNRQSFMEHLEQDLARAQRDDSLVAVLSIDLVQFKQINDSLGHAMGDLLLQIVAGRLKKHARTGDTVAHMGADEFGFVLPGIKSAQAAADFAQRLIASFEHEPVLVGDSEVFVNACVGIAIYPPDGLEANLLLKNASTALHHAKAEGRGSFQYYAKSMNAAAWQQLALETELHRALEHGEFVVYYQPKVALADGKVIGMEALLRWQSPARGLVEPVQFIPSLEKTGLILQVGAWVLDTACRQARAWQDAGLRAGNVAVNLSAVQFRQPDFVASVRGVVERCGLNRDMAVIELELTESILMKDMSVAMHVLNELRDMGARLSIDDFGTGYSSLSYLKHLPVDTLKIDQSFVRHLPGNRDDAAIVNTIIALGHGLGLGVVAEGVETMEQMICLREMKCDEGQGYLFSRPVPADEMTWLLQHGLDMDMIVDTGE